MVVTDAMLQLSWCHLNATPLYHYRTPVSGCRQRCLWYLWGIRCLQTPAFACSACAISSCPSRLFAFFVLKPAVPSW